MTRELPLAGFARRYCVVPWTFALLAAAPVVYIAMRIAAESRNIAFWDEFDSVLALVLRLDAGMGWREFVARIFQLDSEHRTVTSRLIVAASYALTGSVNFNVISALGNASLVALCVLLVTSLRTLAARVRLGVLVAFGLFHLEHYETFLWSGASIDHFLVLMLAGASFVALAQGGRLALGGAGLLALLATFTLAHGCAVWPIGAAMLWHANRRKELVAWCGLAAVALLIFFNGFSIDASHRIRDFSPAGLARLAEFWLALLGGPLTFGARHFAPVFGALLLALLGWNFARGAWSRWPVIAAMALFAVVSLALVAFGRLEVAGAQIQSRYLIIGSLAWSLAAFLLIEQATTSERPYRALAWSLPAVVAFNVAATAQSLHDTEAFLWSRNYAAVRFKQYGEEGHAGPFRLHPGRNTAQAILAQTTARGIYELPRFCEEVAVPDPQPNPDMVTYVTDLTVDRDAVGFEGWAMVPKRKSTRGEIHVALCSEKSFIVLSTFSVVRNDVAKAFEEPLWRYCGYNFVLQRSRLPPEDFRIGLLLCDGEHSEIKMTDQWLRLSRASMETPPLAISQ